MLISRIARSPKRCIIQQGSAAAQPSKSDDRLGREAPRIKEYHTLAIEVPPRPNKSLERVPVHRRMKTRQHRAA